MGCITSVSLAISINGKEGSEFKPSRGLRQGDPLSPYIFLLVCEVLSLKITSSIRRRELTGIKLSPTCPGLSHLFFADDSLFFLKATLPNCLTLNRIIVEYCAASGQVINRDKSSLYFSTNTPQSTRVLIGNLLDVPATDDPGIYLGLPTIWGRAKKVALAYIHDRVLKKIAGWKTSCLSQAGREVLIKAVATAVPSYPMSCFLLPVTLCDKINGELARFWWSGDSGKRQIHWQSWNKLCMNKNSGGMGFRDLRAYNRALLAKKCWRILNNPDALWVRIIKARYFPHSSFLDARIGSRASWGWNSLLVGRSIVEENLRWRVNNGRSVEFWRDRWVPGSVDGLVHPTNTRHYFTP